jgi:hypothetical protein
MTANRIAAVLASALLLTASSASAQRAALEYRPDRVPVGEVFHFVKSQRDGTNAARVSVYVAAPDRVEGLKWSEGDGHATRVTADLGSRSGGRILCTRIRRRSRRSAR